MARRSLPSACIIAIGSTAGCVAYYPVPLRDGAFPATAVQVGERVRVETRGGESSSFEVASVEGGELVGAAGERVTAGDLQTLQVRGLDKKKTFITLGVIGGIIGTALILDEAEEIEDCLEFDDFDDCVE